MAYVVRATWTAREGAEDVVRAALAELAPPSRAEAGNQLYLAYADPAQPRVFHLFEVYDDEGAYRAHTESEHFARLALGTAIPVLDSRERAFFETLEV
jgi:quinol monooxygenase YgiN